MPIYEFLCDECNTVYKFFSKTVNTEKVPACPKCDNEHLRRQVSLFAALSANKEGTTGDDMPHLDEAKMERAMAMLASEAGKVNEDDPRHAASLIRKLSEAAGLKMGEGMEDALQRLEKGEDPEQVEKEMGTLLDNEEPFSFEGQRKKGGSKNKPKLDETLYDL